MAVTLEQVEATVDHMFLCRIATTDSSGNVLLAVGDGGRILERRSDDRVRVQVESKPSRAKVVVNLNTVQVGAKYQGSRLPVYHGAQHVTRLENSAPGINDQFGAQDDVRRHFAAVLGGIYEIRNKLPQFEADQGWWLRNDTTIKGTCTRIRNNVKQCSLGLPSLLTTQDFTLQDILKVCKNVDNRNNTAGIYLRVYSDFKKGTAWEGLEPYLYVGQTNHMWRRQGEHRTDTFDKNRHSYMSYHYQVARAANTLQIVQLCEHEESEGGSTGKGAALRDIMEQLFMLLLGSYSKRALSWKERVEEKELAQVIAEQYTDRELCTIYTDIAQIALDKSGFARPQKPGRAKDFGAAGGLNYMSPLGGEHYQRHERTLWSLQEMEDRWIFHRSSFIFGKDGLLYTQLVGHDTQWTIYSSKAKDQAADVPEEGDRIWTSWEIMKPGKGPHKVPYFRNPEIGPLENWSYANKLGFKTCWKKKGDGKMYVRHYQQTSLGLRYNDTSPAALPSYVHGVAAYAFFTRANWPDNPNWMPSYGRANVAKVSVSRLQQRIDVDILTGSLVTLTGPQFSLEVPRKQMRDLGFENVDSEWQDFHWSWLDKPESYDNGIVPSGRARAAYRGRQKCDYCLIGTMCLDQMKCERAGTSNRCKLCVLRGLPCSWTSNPRLLGTDFWRHSAAEKTTTKTGQHRYAQLFKHPLIEDALKAKAIDDPGFKDIGQLA